MKSLFASRFALLFFLVVGLTSASFCLADNPTQVWQSATLGDSKIGHRQVTRLLDEGRVITRETLVITLQQPGASAKTTKTVMEYVESATGQPLGLSKTIISENANHRMSATVKGKTLIVTLDDKRTLSREIPHPFYLREGIRRRLLMQTGKERELAYHSWNFSSLSFEQVHLRARAVASNDARTLANPDYRWKITRKRLDAGSDPAATVLYTNAGFYPRAEYTNLSGEVFALIECARECALADFSPTTHVYRQLIRSPYRIHDGALAGKIRYRLEGDFKLDPPTTTEQQAKRVAGGLEIEVCARCGGTQAAPTKSELAAALASSYWLPADHPDLRQAAGEILPGRDLDPRSRMERLTRFVSRHMSDEPDYSGYATALEGYQTREGDCTEHALLLAALGRAAGVPTRLVLGLVYNNERFLGRRYVFVPHAWVQAWVGDRWESYDSGMKEFTAGHIALGLGQGEPAAIMQVNEQLHRVDIVSAVQLMAKQ